MATSFHKLPSHLIQIAGIIDAEEAAMLVENGVRFLGFPLHLPDRTKEDLSETDAVRIIRSFPSDCHAVLITYINDAAKILELSAKLGTTMVQLHSAIAMEELEELRDQAPEITIIKSLIVGRQSIADLFELIDQASLFVDAFLIDTFDPFTGASGATGRTHDWSISKRLVERSKLPVILAGGLHPDNVREAILQVRPSGVDSHTGVEGTGGRKDPDRVRRFIQEALNAFHL